METDDWISLISLLMIAILVVPAALRLNRRSWLPYAAIWLAGVVALMWGYDRFGPF